MSPIPAPASMSAPTNAAGGGNQRIFFRALKNSPENFCEKILGETPWEKQREIMRAVRDKKFVSVRSGNGLGKDWVSAVLVLWFLFTRKNSIVITTAPTARQVEEILWGEIRKKYFKCEQLLGGRCLQSKIDVRPGWYALGFSTDDISQFQGYHADDILIIFSEAQGISKKIYEAAKSCLTSQNSRWLLIGNPLIPSGDFYDSQKSNSWHRIKISAMDSPNVIADQELVPGLVSKSWVDDRRAEYGEDHPFWHARVLGEFPPESEDTLIPIAWIDSAIERAIAVKPSRRVLGVDVARYGSCETVVCDFDGYRATFPVIRKDRSTVDSAGDIINHLRPFQVEQFRAKDIEIFVDDIGVGGGVTDILDREGYSVTGVISNARAENEEKFFDLRSEMWWELRDRFQKGTISIPRDEKLVGQLAGLKYEYTTRGAIRLISKEKLRKEGQESPDRGDALAMAAWGWNHGAGRKKVNVNFDHLIAGGRGGW